MKKESTFGYVMRISLTLLIIATVVAAALAVVNNVTKPIIDNVNNEKTQQAIMQVLPGGYEEEISDYADASGLVTKVYTGASGYAVEVTPSGFDGPITMMVGISHEGKVLGISIISHTESAGLGAVAAASNSAGQGFREQFKGMSDVVSVDDGIDAITNATITSRAICDGVNAALACVAGLS